MKSNSFKVETQHLHERRVPQQVQAAAHCSACVTGAGAVVGKLSAARLDDGAIDFQPLQRHHHIFAILCSLHLRQFHQP
jgi:hypothetical protein